MHQPPVAVELDGACETAMSQLDLNNPGFQVDLLDLGKNKTWAVWKRKTLTDTASKDALGENADQQGNPLGVDSDQARSEKGRAILNTNQR